MKKLLFISVIAVLLLSCEGLDQFPQDAISPEIYFRTENDLKLFTNAMYNALPEGTSIFGERMDNIVTYDVSDEVRGTRLVPTSGGGWSWSQLRRINMYLQNSYKCNNEDARKRYNGVAKFFRAYFYFGMVQRFGDVPWYNEVIETDNTAALQKSRDSRVLVVDSMLRDINYAIANLPEARTVNEISKWTALALKARFCLFEGTFRKYHSEFDLPDSDNLLQEAADAAYELITKSGYGIYSATETPYLNLFASNDAIPLEIILARNYSNTLSLRHNANYYTLSSSYGQPGLEKTFVNTYLTDKGTPFTDIPGYNTMEFYDEVQGRDSRLSQTIRTPGYTRIGSTVQLAPHFGYSISGYHLIKFITTSNYDVYMTNVNSLPVFRFAEVLLNYAEAKAELGTLVQDDIDLSIKLLRDRVGMPNLDMANANANPDLYMAEQYPAVSGANKGIILEIRRERGVELVMEGFRWNDLMRWKAGSLLTRTFKGMYFPGIGEYDLDQDGTTDVIIFTGTRPNITGPVLLELGLDIVFDDGESGLRVINGHIEKKFDENKDYLYPIPVNERMMNKNLKQNPGWQDGLNF